MEKLPLLCHRGAVAAETKQVTFLPQPLKDGSGFTVLITWPNGRTQKVGDFRTLEAAWRWIDTDANQWDARFTRLPTRQESIWFLKVFALAWLAALLLGFLLAHFYGAPPGPNCPPLMKNSDDCSHPRF